MLRKFVFALLSVSTAVSANAQDDLLDLLGAEETGPLYSTASFKTCLLYTSDAADERSSVDLGGRRNIKKK